MNIKLKHVVIQKTEFGEQGLIRLDNGLEVSIVRNDLSHGGDKGLYEMGAMKPDGRMVHIEEWEDEVKGWLRPEDIDKELEMLQGLRPLGDLKGTVWENLA